MTQRRPRGKRGTGAKQRRQIQRVAEQRQQTWLGRAKDGHADVSPVPVRVRVAQLTNELDTLYESKREERQ